MEYSRVKVQIPVSGYNIRVVSVIQLRSSIQMSELLTVVFFALDALA